MSDAELLTLRVRLQRIVSALARPRSERTTAELEALLLEVQRDLDRLAPAR